MIIIVCASESPLHRFNTVHDTIESAIKQYDYFVNHITFPCRLCLIETHDHPDTQILKPICFEDLNGYETDHVCNNICGVLYHHTAVN